MDVSRENKKGGKMSADNFLGIMKCKDGKWRGFNLSASMDYPKKKEIEKKNTPVFTAKTKDKAILKGVKETENREYEYGLSIL